MNVSFCPCPGFGEDYGRKGQLSTLFMRPSLCLFVWFRLLCVILVFSNKGQRYLRVRLAVPLFGSVACLRRMVADEGKLSPDQVNNAAICTPKGKSRAFSQSVGVTLKPVSKTTL